MKEIENDIIKKYSYKNYVVYAKDLTDIITKNINDYIKIYKEDYED